MKKILFLIGFLFTAIILSEAVLHINMSEQFEMTGDYLYSDDNDLRYMTSGVQNTSVKSVKYAFINGVERGGSINRPDTLLYGDELTYEIKAVNTSALNTDVVICDAVPEGLAIQTNSITHNGHFDPFTRVITWNMHIFSGDSSERMSYRAGKMTGASGRMVNKAIIDCNGQVEETNSTFHKGFLCRVMFSAGDHGHITNATPQLIDYGRSPYRGVEAVPDLGYTFAGWSYPAYRGLKGEIFEGATEMMDYEWIPVMGDIALTARFEIEKYTIYYELYDGRIDLRGNPESYTVTTGDIVLNEPTKTGYVFTGWTGSNGVTPQRKLTISKGSAGDRMYEANWIETSEMEDAYSISYDYKGGTASNEPNPAYYRKTSSDILLNAPSRPGYSFTGWAITSDVAEVGNVTGGKIPGGAYGNLTCTAGWSLVRNSIHFIDRGDTINIYPDSYVVEDLPFVIDHQPEKPGYQFTGWTGSNGSVPELSVRVSRETTGELTYKANWASGFEKDTVYTCELPVLLASGYNGLDYEWILPDGGSRYSEDLQATVSGRYILRTNYGSMIVADTVVVLSCFETGLAIRDLSKTGNKVGREQIYTVEINPILKNADIQWTTGGGTPLTCRGDTAKVVYHSTSKKRVKVNISIKHAQSACSKELQYDVNIYPVNRGFFVNQHVSGGLQDGSSWANAYYSLQEALAKATEGDYIWVARGEYVADKNASFFVDNNEIEIYGGFNGTEKSLCERDFSANPTTLNGAGRSVIVNSSVSDVRWDGFTIKEGTATRGGGVFNDQSSVIIANCIIRSNEAKEGGGIYSVAGYPVFYNVEISGNQAERGGAMYNERTNSSLTNVTISGNQASSGGGFYNNNSNPSVQNTIIYSNRAQTSPAVYNKSSAPGFSYSLIEGSKDETNWNVLFGIDKGNNLDKDPMFRKDGFDKDGNMQSGNYELFTSSCVINKGNNLHIYDIEVLSDQDLQSPAERVYVTLPYDLNGNERIQYDQTDMGTYEYDAQHNTPDIEREVVLPGLYSIITEPEAGEYKVKEFSDFTFTVTPKPGYVLDNLTVKVGHPAWDERDGIRLTRNDDGSVEVTILKISASMSIKFSGVEAVANAVVNNQEVWSYDNHLYIKSEKEALLKIYTMSGQLYRLLRIGAGETMVDLEAGNYVVVFDGKSYKIKIDG